MSAWRPFTFNEKLALGLFVLFCPVYLIATAWIRPGSVVTGHEFGLFVAWRLGWILLGFLAWCVALATVFLTPAGHPSRTRMQTGRILPLASLGAAVMLSSPAVDAITRQQRRAFAAQNAQALGGPPPTAVIYREGIPDGGVAIVRSPGRDPTGLSQRLMLDLTGERIKSCELISDTDWSCYFD